jgi:hypothetical protein
VPDAAMLGDVSGIGTTARAGDWEAARVLWLPIRVFLVAGWLRAAVAKAIDPSWWSGEQLLAFLSQQRGLELPLVRSLVDTVIEPAAAVVAGLVVVAQFATAVGFLTRRWFEAALHLGIGLNLAFLAMGAVNPSAFYVVMQLSLLAALREGVVDGRPRAPGRSGVIGSLAVTALGLSMLPFVRTLEPSAVIEDPAIMLAFLALLAGGSGLLRWLLHARSRPMNSEHAST